jgi:ASPIC and UnbV
VITAKRRAGACPAEHGRERARMGGLELPQRGPNPSAIGAAVVVDAGPTAGRLFRVRADPSYLSASDPRVLIGLGDHRGPPTAVITWPDGSRTRCTLVPGRYQPVCTVGPGVASAWQASGSDAELRGGPTRLAVGQDVA